MQTPIDPYTQLIAMRASGEITAEEYKLARQHLDNQRLAQNGPITQADKRPPVAGPPRYFLGIDWRMLALKIALGFIATMVVLGVSSAIFGAGKSLFEVELATSGSTQRADDPCSTAASAIARVTGGSVGQRTGLGSITVKHPSVSEVHVFCTDGRGKKPVLAAGAVDAMSVFTRGDIDDYLNFFSQAASELAEYDPKVLRAAAQACLLDAMRSAKGVVYRNVDKFGLMCDGGPTWGRPYDISIEGAFSKEAVSN